MNLVVRMKTGSGRRTYVWFSEDDGYHVHYMMRDEHGLYVAGARAGVSANEAATCLFMNSWWGKHEIPAKFYIRRAKAGIKVIDHARERGL